MKQSTGNIKSFITAANVVNNNIESSAPTGRAGKTETRFPFGVNSWLSIAAIVVSLVTLAIVLTDLDSHVLSPGLLVSALSLITAVLLVKQLVDYFGIQSSLDRRQAQIEAKLLSVENTPYNFVILSELIALCVSLETNNAPLRWGEADSRLPILISRIKFLRANHPDALLICCDILSQAIGRLSVICDFNGMGGVADYDEYIRKNQKNIDTLIAMRDELPIRPHQKSDTSSKTPPTNR